MAEVKIEIVAEDMASDVISSVRDAALGAAQSIGEFTRALGADAFTSGLNALREALSGLGERLAMAVTLDTAQAVQSVTVLEDALASVPERTVKSLALDVSQALTAAAEVQASINSIPDVTYKTVIVQYMTQASPVMNFTEGMEHIKELMNSLPSDGTYTVNFDINSQIDQLVSLLSDPVYWQLQWKDPERAREEAAQIMDIIDNYTDMLAKQAKDGGGQGQGGGGDVVVNIGEINIDGEIKDGTDLGKKVQKVIADDIRGKRSPIVPALRDVGAIA